MLIDPLHYVRWFPEIARFRTAQDRLDALRAAQSKALRTWRFWVSFGVLLPVLSFAFSFLLLPVLVRSVGGVGFFGLPVLGFLIGGLLVVGQAWVSRRFIQRSLREQLIERGERVCMKCGYDLRGQDDPRCPECGEAFVRSR